MPNKPGVTMAAPCGTLTAAVAAAPGLTMVFGPGLHCSCFVSCVHFFRAGSVMNNEESKVGEAGQKKKGWSSCKSPTSTRHM